MLIVTRGIMVGLLLALAELGGNRASAQELKPLPSDASQPAEAADSSDNGDTFAVAPATPETPATSDSAATGEADESPSKLMPFEEEHHIPLPGATEQSLRNANELPDVPDLVTPNDLRPALSIIPVLHLGPVAFAFGLRFDTLYDSNILLAPSNAISDVEYVVAPRLSLSVGDSLLQKGSFLSLIYQPQFLFFQNHSGYDAIDQQLRLDGQYVTTHAIVTENLDYDHSSDPDRELQGRQSRDMIDSETTATYQASERFAYELDGSALVRNFQNEINAEEGRLRGWVRYAISPTWTVAVGAAGGGLTPSQGADRVFGQGWLGTQAQIGNGLSFNLSFGGETREAEGIGGTLATPVFNASVEYALSQETKFELLASRQIFDSPDVVNVDYISTKVSAKAIQRLWDAYKFSVEAGYENAGYFQYGDDTAGARNDNYPYARVEFSYARFADLQCGIYYLYQRNFSSQSELSFLDQQVGANVRIGF